MLADRPDARRVSHDELLATVFLLFLAGFVTTFHFTGRPISPHGDELSAARRFMAAHRG